MRPAILLTLSLTLTLFGLSLNVYSEMNPCLDHQCLGVVDSGSTGSRFHVFAYDLDSTHSPYNIREIWSNSITPGLAHVQSEALALSLYLNKLFANAPFNSLPVYWYATAGMRLLPATHQRTYYQHIKEWFAEQTSWQLKDAKTITGFEEALYDWLAVNYHLGNLQDLQKASSVGVMDMGGASVQIIFPAKDSEDQESKSRKTFSTDPHLQKATITLYGQHLDLYMHSFLGLGQTEVAHQFLNKASCFAEQYPLPDGAIGQGNASLCVQEVAKLMLQVHDVNQHIQPLLTANPVKTWYAIGGLSYLADNDNLFHFTNHSLTNKDLLHQADLGVCQRNWQELTHEHSNDAYLSQYCLISSYYYALMVEGYGIYPEKTIHYVPATQNMDWTVGVVLLKAP